MLDGKTGFISIRAGDVQSPWLQYRSCGSRYDTCRFECSAECSRMNGTWEHRRGRMNIFLALTSTFMWGDCDSAKLRPERHEAMLYIPASGGIDWVIGSL